MTRSKATDEGNPTSGRPGMDSAKLNDWMQVIGIFALVASLVFVGLQMKRPRRSPFRTHIRRALPSS
jgi:hypothetical protein